MNGSTPAKGEAVSKPAPVECRTDIVELQSREPRTDVVCSRAPDPDIPKCRLMDVLRDSKTVHSCDDMIGGDSPCW